MDESLESGMEVGVFCDGWKGMAAGLEEQREKGLGMEERVEMG